MKPESKPDAASRARSGAAMLWTHAKRALTRHVLQKVFALLLAMLLWSVLIASDNSLTREKAFPNVEVTVTGQDALKARGLIVIDDLSELIPSVRVRADVAQGSYDRITASYFSPRIDLSQVRQAGVQALQITVSPTASAQVLEVDPAYVTVDVQEYATIGRVPVVVEAVGEARPDLWVDTPRTDPALVSVSGPRAMVDQVARVVAKLDLATLSADRGSTRSAVRLMPADAEDNDLSSPLLQVSSFDGVILDTVVMDVSCYPRREIPVDLTGAVQGEPAEGYALVSIESDPAVVAVAAPLSALDELSLIFIEEPIHIEGVTATLSASARIKRLADAKHTGVEEVVITATIAEERVERTFRNLPIEVRGLSDDKTAKLKRAKTNLTITGAYHWMKQLKDANVFLSIDVADLPPGEYELPVEVRVEGSVGYAYALDDTVASVTIAQKAN